MKLYHGTRAENLHSILINGLVPRTESKGNWEHTVSSRQDCVYLTSVYAPYFAIQASDNNQLCILEIDTNLLDQESLLPDEDFLEQATRGREPFGTMHTRTEFFRDNLLDYHEYWEKSIQHMGTCCYQDVIDKAITRVVTVNANLCPGMLSVALDPMISILNHSFCKKKYEALTAWFMLDDVEAKDIFSFGPEHWDMISDAQKDVINKVVNDRSMITVVNFLEF